MGKSECKYGVRRLSRQTGRSSLDDGVGGGVLKREHLQSGPSSRPVLHFSFALLDILAL